MQGKANITTRNVWEHYSKNLDNLRKSMFRLSTGVRVNNGDEDPLGLPMSERLRMHKRNSFAAEGNIKNRLSSLRMADSWVHKIQDLLVRMSELAGMAAVDGCVTADRNLLLVEFQQVQAAICTIVNESATVNTNHLFGTEAVILQVGPLPGQEYIGESFNLTASNSYDLGGKGWDELIDSTLPGTVSIGTRTTAGATVGIVISALQFIGGMRVKIGAEISRMEQALSGLMTYEENISSAESRIRDVDTAKEAAEISRCYILKQMSAARGAHAHLGAVGELKFVV